MNAIGKLGCIIVIVNLCLCKIALSQQEVEVPDPNSEAHYEKHYPCRVISPSQERNSEA